MASLEAPTAVSDPDRSTEGGPPRFFALSVLPSGTVLAGTCGKGTARSADGGRTWEPSPDGPGSGTVNTLAAGPDGAVFAATAGTGLFRSPDEGLTWAPSGLDGVTVFSVAADPASGAVVAGTDGLGAFSSTDGGGSWSATPDSPLGARIVYRLLVLGGGRVLAGTDSDGVWLGEAGTWEQVGLGTSSVFALADLGDGRVLAGTRGDGVHRSDDGGATWRPVGVGLPDPAVHVLVTDGRGGVLAGTGQGVVRSDDAGDTWTAVGTELANHRVFSLAATADGAVLAGSYDGVWRWDPEAERWDAVDTGLNVGEAYAVYHDPATGHAFAGARSSAFRSADAGATWEPLPGGLDGLNAYAFLRTSVGELLTGTDRGVWVAPGDGGAEWEPAGLEGQRVFGLAEVDGARLLAGTLGGGVYGRDLPGDDWQPASEGLSNPHVYDFLVSHRGGVFAATGAVVDGAKTGLVYRSTDGGRSWAPTGHEPITVYRVVESSSGILFGGARRSRLLRSGNGGDTWELLDPTGLVDTKLYCLAIDAADRLYLGAGAVLLRSDDGADTWQVIGDGLDGVTVFDLCAHPEGALLAATSSGLYRSLDAGETWRPAPWS